MSTKTKPFSTRLSDDVRQALQARAQALGLTESDVGRMFILQQLQANADPIEALRQEIRSLVALIIAALSDSIDLEQARDLVTDQLTPMPEGVARD